MTYKIKETKQGYVYYTGLVELDSVKLPFDFRIREANANSESFVRTWARSEAVNVIEKNIKVEVEKEK